jgi:hypothetical protein
MHNNCFSSLELVVALDPRNLEAHFSGAIGNCIACATVPGPPTACPAGRAAEIRRTTAARTAHTF